MASRCRVGHRSRHSGRRRHRPRTHLLEVGTEKPRRGRPRCRPPDDWDSLLAGVVGARNCSRHRLPRAADSRQQRQDSLQLDRRRYWGCGFHVAHRRLVLSLSSSAESIRAHLSICSTPSTWATTKTSTIPAAPRGIFMCTRYSGLGRNTPPIAFCASSIAFFWASHCRSARSVIAFSWAFHCCSTRSVIAFR